MSSEPLSSAARNLLEKTALIMLDEALVACPWRSLLRRERNAEEMMECLGATIAVIDRERSPLSADVLADAVATLAGGQSVLVIAARRSDRDYAKRQILAMAGNGGLQTYSLNGNGILTPGGSPQDARVKFHNIAWDSSNHVFVTNDTQLYVFNSGNGLLAPASGSPYAGGPGLAVLPLQ